MISSGLGVYASKFASDCYFFLILSLAVSVDLVSHAVEEVMYFKSFRFVIKKGTGLIIKIPR